MLQVVFHARSSDAFASGRCAHALRPALTSGSPGEKQCSSHSFQTADNFFLHSTRWLRGASYQSSVADDVAQPHNQKVTQGKLSSRHNNKPQQARISESQVDSIACRLLERRTAMTTQTSSTIGHANNRLQFAAIKTGTPACRGLHPGPNVQCIKFPFSDHDSPPSQFHSPLQLRLLRLVMLGAALSTSMQ